MHGAVPQAHRWSVLLIIKLQIQHITRHIPDSANFLLSILLTVTASSTESSSIANTISSTSEAGGECLHAHFHSQSFNFLFEVLALPRDACMVLLSSLAGNASLFFPFGLDLVFSMGNLWVHLYGPRPVPMSTPTCAQRCKFLGLQVWVDSRYATHG